SAVTTRRAAVMGKASAKVSSMATPWIASTAVVRGSGSWGLGNCGHYARLRNDWPLTLAIRATGSVAGVATTRPGSVEKRLVRGKGRLRDTREWARFEPFGQSSPWESSR